MIRRRVLRQERGRLWYAAWLKKIVMVLIFFGNDVMSAVVGDTMRAVVWLALDPLYWIKVIRILDYIGETVG
jgi:hypothetical protein